MKQILRTSLLFITGFFIQPLQINANNISVSNISITGQNTTAGTNNAANYSMVKFNLAWENSWRSAALNWDAAWVFVKYRVNGGAWNHCNLHNTGHTAPTGSTIDAGLVTPSSAFNVTSNPAVGVFIYKNADGNGNVNYQNVQLRWNYGSQGVTDNDILDVQVFATEMVYVPTGTFAVGDGVNGYTLTTINTGNATTAPSGTGSLGGQAGGYPTGTTAPSSSSFPNGYNAFYCMKYEISQGQYVDYLNTLTLTEQISRTNNSIQQPLNVVGSYALVPYNWLPTTQNEVKVKIPANIITQTPANFESSNNDFACNFLQTDDISAILNWSGLRPMTELEYEKACRGTLPSIPNEYAWGNSGISNNTNLIRETNIVTRVGYFATSISSRIDAGATFYGIMDMSSNVLEYVIKISGSEGFRDGYMRDALNQNWVTQCVSCKLYDGGVYDNMYGGRGVRSAQ